MDISDYVMGAVLVLGLVAVSYGAWSAEQSSTERKQQAQRWLYSCIEAEAKGYQITSCHGYRSAMQ